MDLLNKWFPRLQEAVDGLLADARKGVAFIAAAVLSGKYFHIETKWIVIVSIVVGAADAVIWLVHATGFPRKHHQDAEGRDHS